MGDRDMTKRALLLGTSLALVAVIELGTAQAWAQTAPVRDPSLTPGPSLASQAAQAQSSQQPPEETGEDIVVTGTLRDVAENKAAVSTTSVSGDRIQEVVPLGAADLLSEIPGVVVDTDVGETNANVYARGLSSGTSASTTGYYWTTILEDGLPVTPLFFSNYQPDQFLRPDVTVKRVQAVRGGSASVTGPNAPGGLFNYISRNGITDPGTRYSLRFGIEGGNQLYQKYELYYGWRNKERNLGFSIGGNYRQSYGYRPLRNPLNDGGQIKVNGNWSYNAGLGTGGFLLSYKHLDDVAGTLDAFRPIARGFDNPQFTQEFGRNVNFTPIGDIAHYSIYNGKPDYFWDGNAGPKYRADAIALKWDHNFGGGWRFSNNAKYNRNQGRQTNLGASTYRGLFASDTFNLLGTSLAGLNTAPGFFTLRDRNSGNVLARVYRVVTAGTGPLGAVVNCAPPRNLSTTTGFCLDKNTPNLLPNQQIVNDAPGDASNLVLGYGNGNGNLILTSKDFTDQFLLTKAFKRVTLTAGFYLSDIHFSSNGAFAGYALAPLQNQPDTLDISYTTTSTTTGGGATGTTYQLTDPTGFASIGSSAGIISDDTAYVREFSPLFGATWEITNKLLLDGGLRYTFYRANGVNHRFQTNPNATSRTFGGVDGNPLTIYDNVYAVDTPAGTFPFDKSVQYLQYTGAINWNINRNNTVYARYTNGTKNGDGFWNSFSTFQSTVDDFSLTPLPKLTQYEVSWTFRNRWMTNQVVGYFTDVNNVSNRGQNFLLSDGITRYTSRPFYNHLDTLGVELDNKITFFKWLNVRNVLTWNRSRALAQASVTSGACNGTAYLTNAACRNPDGTPIDVTLDDTATYNSGPQERSPSIIYNGTVNLKFGPFSGYYRFRYIDDRPTAITNIRFLPPQKNSDMGVRWQINRRVNAAFNINNLFNDVNLTQIGDLVTRPTNLTDEQFQDLYPNALITVRTNAPRAYFLTFSGSF